MKKKKTIRKEPQKRNNQQIALWLGDDDAILCPGYTSLDHNPEIMTACHKIAELIGSITIHLMANTERGDQRIQNELSRKIDIEPEMHMTRSTWMQAIVMNLLLYGKGNSIVVPHTYGGILQGLEPIGAGRVSFLPSDIVTIASALTEKNGIRRAFCILYTIRTRPISGRARA